MGILNGQSSIMVNQLNPTKRKDAVELLLGFSNLAPNAEKQFMEQLNRYLYASPSRKKEMALQWIQYSEQTQSLA
jgi:hypothetical protein